MVSDGELSAGTSEFDFFISYSPADEPWAAWMAWTLEEAGYRTVVQAWDFVPGTNFIDYMDRGVSESAAVIAILSQHYERSIYGRMEWQAALRAAPEAPERRLLTVRVDDMPIEGLLATLTYVDLVGVNNADAARSLLLTRVEQALDGHARPARRPGYPGSPPAPGRPVRPDAYPPGPDRDASRGPGRSGRRRPARAPGYPPAPAGAPGRDSLTVLHLAGPDFGRGREPETLARQLRGDIVELRDAGAPAPDLLVVTGDLTSSGSPRECDQALSFLTALRSQLELSPQRVVVVPGAQDVNQAACRGYFHTCEADEVAPQAPYWPKWRHYTRLFHNLHQGLDTVFDSDQPWTLFPLPELSTVVAGFNSTMAFSHRADDQYGSVGRDQVAWFAEALRGYEEEGWLRIGALRHPLTGVRHRADTAGGPGPLRDADVLTRLAGPRLNLLFHGPSGGPRTTGGEPTHYRTGAGAGLLPVFGSAAPARFQLLQITADGATRWDDRTPGAQPSRFPTGPWRHTGRAFPAEPAAPTAPDFDRPPPFDAPADSLTDRVKEICRARREGVGLRDIPRRHPGDMTQIMATWQEDGVVRQQRIAIHPDLPTEAELDRFVAQAHAMGNGADAVLVYAGGPPGPALRARAAAGGIRVGLRSFIEFQGLLDLRGYVTAQTARLDASELYPPARYLTQRYRDADRTGGGEHTGLVEDLIDLLDSDPGRFLLLLGDFGHGKTFALRELARRIPEQLPHLIPLLIPLNTLDRAHTLEGLVAAHLAGHGVDVIDLRALRYMLAEGRVVLLFDGFDELVNRVSYDRAADHLQVLLDAAVDRAKIVVSSRTQHFKSHDQILTALGERVGLLPQRRILSVEGFTHDQIRAYLQRLYGDERLAGQRFRLLRDIPDLLTLCSNPRLLSFAAVLGQERLHAVVGAGRALSPARLYEDVFTSWIDHEQQRGQGGAGAAPGLGAEALWSSVTALALRLWESGRTALRLDELTETVSAALSGLTASELSTAESAQAVGAGSLLVRSDDGVFQFIHGSVLEWLIAREAAHRLDRGDHLLLATRTFSQLAVEFLCDLADHERCAHWVRDTLDPDGPPADEISRANALRIGDRLRVPAGADLRGARLAGENLSHRDFSGADLTGADLTDAQLTGAGLSGAVLRDAVLAGARLDHADLTGADLTGADLTGSRLIAVDLSGARLTGSRWHRAALIAPVIDDTVRTAPELAAAALAPGMSVEAGHRPSSVGVPYGFDMRTSRLPEPIAYSPDGELLAVGSEDGGVLICGADTGQALRTLQGHSGRVYAVKIAADTIATAGSDGTVRLWDPVSGACRHLLEVHPDGVWPLVLDTTGALLATGDKDGLVTVWSVATGEALHRLPGHTAPVYTAVFAPGVPTLITGDAAGRVRRWDLSDGSCAGELPGHLGSVYRTRFSPDGSLLATTDQGDAGGGTVRIWDAVDFRLLHTLTGHTGRVYALDFHPDGNLLATGDTEGQVRLWDPVVGTPAGALERCSGAVYQVLFHPTGQLLTSCDSDGKVRLWRVAGQGRVVTLHGGQPTAHRGSAWACAFRPRDRQLLTVGNDGGAQIWDADTGQGRRILRGHGRRVTGLSFSADGALLAAAGNDGVVRLWETATGRRTEEITGRGNRLVSAFFSPAEDVLAVASNDGDIHLRALPDGAHLREIDAETEHIWAGAFSADGRLIATANDDDTVRLWYRSTGAPVATLTEHRGRVRSIAFTPGSSPHPLLATGCDDGAVRLWRPGSGELLTELRTHTDRVYGAAFGRDGSWLATAGWDGLAVVWRDGAAAHRLVGHRGKLWAVAAHPSRPLVATAGDDRVIGLWNAETGARLAGLTGHAGRILALAFSPDGGTLAGAGEDGTVRLWTLPADGSPPRSWATLIGLPGGWATLTPSGGYKYDGDAAGEFWHVVGMTRFTPGELDPYLPEVRRLATGEPLRTTDPA